MNTDTQRERHKHRHRHRHRHKHIEIEREREAERQTLECPIVFQSGEGAKHSLKITLFLNFRTYF